MSLLFNKNFYPTPNDLIDKMIDKISLYKLSIDSILDPSCGKGNILDRIKEKTKYENKRIKVYGIEIDNNLKAICKNKGYRIIHDNFLTYNTFQKFSVIMMNPPFDNGDEHLLKAIEMQEKTGGEIVCLLNAETIKNPYSNKRKTLIKKLDRHKADIEYIEDGFKEAERKTNVSTALIYMNIETKKERDSIILEHLRKQEYELEQGSNEIVSDEFMEQILQKYNFEIKAGLKLINEYNKIFPMLSRDFDNKWPTLKLTIDDSNFHGNIEDVQQEFIKRIRYKYWTTLFKSKQFSRLFTSDLKQQYLSKMEELEEYDFSKYNIEQIQLDMKIMLKDSLEKTIYDLFDWFISHSYSDSYKNNIWMYDGWKTNEAYKINEKKIIMPLSAYCGVFENFSPTDFRFSEKLIDIYKVFSYLDNGRTEISDSIQNILKQAKEDEQTRNIDCEYFKITCYKKGTTHFEWTNKDLVKKLNIEGARGRSWIPPSYGEKFYKDMSKEEKKVIDNFEGEKEYMKTMRDKEFYLNSVNDLLQITG